jgi:hypothetical protein
MASSSQKASRLPLVIGISSIVLSLVLMYVSFQLTEHNNWLPSLLGWLLTPVLTFTMVGIDFYLQNRADLPVTFESRSIYSKILRLNAYASVLFALGHIIRLAQIWSVT